MFIYQIALCGLFPFETFQIFSDPADDLKYHSLSAPHTHPKVMLYLYRSIIDGTVEMSVISLIFSNT